MLTVILLKMWITTNADVYAVILIYKGTGEIFLFYCNRASMSPNFPRDPSFIFWAWGSVRLFWSRSHQISYYIWSIITFTQTLRLCFGEAQKLEAFSDPSSNIHVYLRYHCFNSRLAVIQPHYQKNELASLAAIHACTQSQCFGYRPST